MAELAERQGVIQKIERVFTCFQQVLKAGVRPSFFLPDPEGNEAEILELHSRNSHRFLFVSQVLLAVYALLKTNTYRTKRDIFYEYKYIFGTQAALDDTVNFVTRLLQESRYNVHILATSKGLVTGDLRFKLPPGEEDGSGAEVDCRGGPVPIPMLPNEVTNIRSNASFILIAEKDATFQSFVVENSCATLGPCIMMTAKGYPDYATRIFLHRLHTELLLPVYALMDGDPYGIEIYLIYKYGSATPQLYDAFEIRISSLIWLGIFPTEASTLDIDDLSKLALSDRERNRALSLLHRTTTLNERFVHRQLQHLLDVGFKVEIEAVAAIGQGYLTRRYLKSKLRAMTSEE